jgi:hypothetical protein
MADATFKTHKLRTSETVSDVKQLYPQHLVFVTPLLLSAAIVEKLEPVWVCCGWRALVMMGGGTTRNM